MSDLATLVREGLLKAIKDAQGTAVGIARVFRAQRLYNRVLNRARKQVKPSNWATWRT